MTNATINAPQASYMVLSSVHRAFVLDVSVFGYSICQSMWIKIMFYLNIEGSVKRKDRKTELAVLNFASLLLLCFNRPF